MRGYLASAASIGAAIISNSDNWPASTTVLTVGDTIQFESHTTSYTITVVSGSTSSSGILTSFEFTPTLSENVPDNTAIICPSPRTIESAMKTAVAAETGTICYFMQFDFEDLRHISSFANSALRIFSLASVTSFLFCLLMILEMQSERTSFMLLESNAGGLDIKFIKL